MANIAILVPRFPPAPGAGVQVQAQDWANRLAAAGHHVTVITRRDPVDLPSRETREGYTIIRSWGAEREPLRFPRLPAFLRNKGLSRPLRVLEDKVRLWSDLRGVSRGLDAIDPAPDVLLCFMTLPTGLLGVLVGRRCGIPAVVWIRGESDYLALRSMRSRQSLLQAWEGAAGVLVQSDKAKTDFLAEIQRVAPASVPVVRDKLVVVENGVALPTSCEYDSAGPVLAVGRLVPEKGMNVVVESCARLGRPLIVAGRGPELPRLTRQAAALGADVTFTGFVDRNELDSLYRQASVVVLNSESEGMPNVVLEAMAYARPVVTTPVGCVPDLITDDRNGLLVPPGDTGALTSALARLAADPRWARGLGSAARATAERYAWHIVVPKLEEALEHWRRR